MPSLLLFLGQMGAPVAYGSLRAATRRTGKGKSHEFRKFWCRMILCAELGAIHDVGGGGHLTGTNKSQKPHP